MAAREKKDEDGLASLMTTTTVRWMFVFPAAAVMIPIIDNIVVGMLGAAGVQDLSAAWVLGKLVGHATMGFLAVVAGAWTAPSHRREVSAGLAAIAAAASLVALFTRQLPLMFVLPLTVAFLGGAGGAAAIIWSYLDARQDARGAALAEEEPDR